MPGWRILLRNEQRPAGKGRRGQGAAVIGMAVFLVCVFSLCVGVGSVAITPVESLRIIWGQLTGRGNYSGLNPSLVSILWDIRMPRVAMAFLSGGALSLSGAVMQTILQNPLASSYTLGVSSGASLGAAIVIASGISLPVLGTFLLPVTAFFMGFLVIAVVCECTPDAALLVCREPAAAADSLADGVLLGYAMVPCENSDSHLSLRPAAPCSPFEGAGHSVFWG